MIISMKDIDEAKITAFILVLERENLERMKRHDPITLESVANGGALPTPKYPDRMMMLVAYEDETEELYKIISTGSMGDLLEFLRRGYKFIKGLDGTVFTTSLNHPPKES